MKFTYQHNSLPEHIGITTQRLRCKTAIPTSSCSSLSTCGFIRKIPGKKFLLFKIPWLLDAVLLYWSDKSNDMYRVTFPPSGAHDTAYEASLPKQVGFYLEKANEQTAMAVFLTAEKTPGWWRSGDVTPTRKGVVPSLQETWYLRFLVGLNKENNKGGLRMVRGRIR